MSERYKRNPNVNCLVCKKPIYRRPVEIQENKGRVFCSSGCYGISQRKETPCIVCGTPILAHRNARTCSRSCANKYRTGIKYKLGRPSKSKVTTLRALKIRLLNQRGVKCERCGYNRIEILHVHHKDRNRENNELENLELICPNCHYEEHYLENSWLSGNVARREGSDSGSFQRT